MPSPTDAGPRELAAATSVTDPMRVAKAFRDAADSIASWSHSKLAELQRALDLHDVTAPVRGAAAEKAERFKAYVHGRLDAAGVPIDPDPEANAKHGCRIEGRLNWVLGRAAVAQARAHQLRAALDEALTAIDQVEAEPGAGSIFKLDWSKDLKLIAESSDENALRALLASMARRMAGLSGRNPWSEAAIAEAVEAVLRGDRG
jgi:hypothetical protein